MEGLWRIGKVVLIILGIVLVGVLIGMMGTGGREINISSAMNATATNATPMASPSLSVPPLKASPPTNPATAPATEEPAFVPRNTSPTNVSIVITNWEDRLDEILAATTPDIDKAKRLLAIFPNTTQEGQVELAAHLSNLVPDEDYAQFGNYLTNTALSEDVLDIILSDLLNRPDTLKLPLLVDVAKDPRNPKAGEAKDLLELYLEEDYGTDWATWRSKVDQWLKENP